MMKKRTAEKINKTPYHYNIQQRMKAFKKSQLPALTMKLKFRTLGLQYAAMYKMNPTIDKIKRFVVDHYSFESIGFPKEKCFPWPIHIIIIDDLDCPMFMVVVKSYDPSYATF
jgi:hypothetical protein